MTTRTDLLTKALTMKAVLGCETREDALEDIRLSIETTSLFSFAKMFGVLENGSAEEFAIQFYTAYNQYRPGTY